MPRIRTSQSDPLDFCKQCFPNEADAMELYYNLGDGPDERGNCFGYEDDHPAYECENYTCEKCGRLLKEEDN